MRLQRPNDKRWDEVGQALASARSMNREHHIPLLVEGKRDVGTLRAFGFSGPIEQFHRGKSNDEVIVSIVETYSNQIHGSAFFLYLLMDWDRTGGRIQNICRRNFESLDLKFDEELRRCLMKNLFSETTTVEGLIGSMDHLLPIIDTYDPIGNSCPDR